MKTVMIVGAMALALGVGANDAAAAPKKGCKGAPAQRAICADSELGALAKETDRLSALAQKSATKQANAAFAERQKEWRGERDACGEARDCLVEQHLARIHALRQTLASDQKGISRGPTVYVCDGVADPVSVTTASTKTPRAYVAWGDYAYVLNGDGASGRYAAELDTGPMSFTRAAASATLTIPGRGEAACRPAS